jgi:hypothetical protein
METLKPNFQDMAQDFEKRIYKSVLDFFYTRIHARPCHFLKIHYNPGTLLYTTDLWFLHGKCSVILFRALFVNV